MTARPRQPGAPTLSDVARAAGVSPATASRVFSGLATVDAALATRVLQAGERLGYHPDVAAQMTANGGSRLVGVITDEPRSAHFGAILRGIVHAVGERGFTAMVFGAADGPDSFAAAARTLAGYRPRAVILISRSAALADVSVPFLADRETAVVTLGHALTAPGEQVVELDDVSGAIELAEAMGARGYARPVILGTGEDYPAEASRTKTLATEVARWAPRVATVAATEPSRDAGYAAMTFVLDGPLPDIVLAAADELAIGVLAALRDHGVEPGTEVAVTGFDDLPSASDVVPALTTVRTGLKQAGARAVLCALDGSREVPSAPTSLAVFRDSTR